MTRAERARAERQAKSRGHETWAVQIGAYRSRGDAREELSSLGHRYAKLGDADTSVEAARHGYYRARFSGLSEEAAKRACAALRAHHQTCAIVNPDG
jgi:D-alanyl-D-alanine carboxypeptidase (penicillin-binding protein 5/6)